MPAPPPLLHPAFDQGSAYEGSGEGYWGTGQGSPELALWRAVLAMALQTEKKEWFDTSNSSFLFVCEMADINPAYLSELVEREHAAMKRRCR